MQYSGTRTTAIEGQGYAIQGGLDAKTSNSLQQAVAKQQAVLHSAHASAAYNFAMGEGTSRGSSQFERWEQGMDESRQNQYSDVKQTISGITERVAKSHGFEGEQVAQAQRVLSAGAYAGVDFSSDKQALGAVFEAFTGSKVGMGRPRSIQCRHPDRRVGTGEGGGTGDRGRAQRQQRSEQLYSSSLPCHK